MRIEITYDNGLDDIEARAEQALAACVKRLADDVCVRAKEICPVDTGALRDSITVSADSESARISADADYAAYVEFGTSRARAQPYLVPALLETNVEAAAKAIGEIFG